jgi:hypothetical protein
MYLLIDAVSRPDFTASNDGMSVINESERIWKEAVVIFMVNETRFLSEFLQFSPLIIVPPFLYIQLSRPPEVCNGSDRQHINIASVVNLGLRLGPGTWLVTE